MSIRELGVTNEMLDGIAEGSFIMDAGTRPCHMRKLWQF
mgnify:CR=1 FL=1